MAPPASASAPAAEKDKSKVHKLSLKGSAKLVAEFVGTERKSATSQSRR